MSLRRHYKRDVLDASLGRILKNWMAGKNPPANGRALLLQTAMKASTPKAPRISFVISLLFGSDFIDPYSNDCFLIATTFSFKPGLLGVL